MISIKIQTFYLRRREEYVCTSQILFGKCPSPVRILTFKMENQLLLFAFAFIHSYCTLGQIENM